MKSRTLHVPAEPADQTVSAFLRSVLADMTGPGARRLVDERRVQLNGNLCVDPAKRLRAGDVVKLLAHPVSAAPTARDIRIRFVDPHLVVVEKPAGMTTMSYGDEVSASGRRNRQATLLDLLPTVLAAGTRGDERQPTRAAPRNADRRTGRRGANSRTGARKERVLPVHRLDRDTSGLMVFALTPESARALTAMFREHDLERSYRAIVRGAPEEQTIESFIAEDRGDGHRGSVDDAAAGKKAVTHLRPLEALGGYALVECRLETGRTHQIRIHLSERGHPICGDRTYRRPLGQRAIPDRSGAPRLALHAAELTFAHPVTGKRMSLRSPLPEDLTEFVRRLRNQARHGDTDTKRQGEEQS